MSGFRFISGLLDYLQENLILFQQEFSPEEFNMFKSLIEELQTFINSTSTISSLFSSSFSSFVSTVIGLVIIWAQNQVSLFDSPIPDLPWGIVSLVDLYSGFILICVWIIYKESLPTAIIWSFFVLILGNLTTAIYVIYSINKSRGNIVHFFMGKNS